MSTNVGLLTPSGGAPSPAAIPRTSAVLPAPSGPDNARDSPPLSTEPMARPSRSVCRSEGKDCRQPCLVSASRLTADRLNGIGDLFNEVAGDHAGRSQPPGCQVACCAMQIRGGAGRFPGGNALREEAHEHAGEDVSGSCGGHSRISCWTDHEQTIGPGNDRSSALQHEKDAAFPGKTSGRAEAIRVDAL